MVSFIEVGMITKKMNDQAVLIKYEELRGPHAFHFSILSQAVPKTEITLSSKQIIGIIPCSHACKYMDCDVTEAGICHVHHEPDRYLFIA